MSRERIDAEGRDAEVEPDGTPGTAAVGDLVDFVKLRNCVTTHWAALLQVVVPGTSWRPSLTTSRRRWSTEAETVL
jgi:hypothetical protein